MTHGAGVITDLFSNGKGKWTVLTALMMTLAGGLSWWFTIEARQEIEELRDYVDGRIKASIDSHTAFAEQRFVYMAERMNKLESEARDTHGRIWAEIAQRPNRDAQETRQREVDRRLEAIERRLDRIQDTVYGRP